MATSGVRGAARLIAELRRIQTAVGLELALTPKPYVPKAQKTKAAQVQAERDALRTRLYLEQLRAALADHQGDVQYGVFMARLVDMIERRGDDPAQAVATCLMAYNGISVAENARIEARCRAPARLSA